MGPSNNLEKKIPWDAYWVVQLVCMKVQAHSFLEPPLKYYQVQMPLMNQGSSWPFKHLTILGVIEILCIFRLALEGKIGKEIPESSRLQFLEKFLASSFASSDTEDSIYVTLNRRGIADLALLRTLLAICQKSQERSFWDVVDSFVLLAYASLATSRALLQQLLASLNFTLDSGLFYWYK